MASVEQLLKETLETRIAERNQLVDENRHLKSEIGQLGQALAANDAALAELDAEIAEAWDQNCLLEGIVRKKNDELAEFGGLEKSYNALKFKADRLRDELGALKNVNESLVSQVNADKRNQDTMFKQFLHNVRDLVEENHLLKDSLKLLEKNLAEAKNDFKIVCQRLAVTEKNNSKKYKVSLRN